MALVIVLVGGRYCWILAKRPVHERELATAYGSVGLFFGPPQSDRSGKRITYVETADVGFGVFLANIVTGQKQNVREPSAKSEGDFPDLRVWPWSPDDSSFIYTDNQRVLICDSQTGKSMAKLDLPTPVTDLAWLSPETLVCFDASGKLYQLDRQPDGTWTSKRAAAYLGGDFELRSTGIGVAAVASQAAPGAGAENAIDGNEATSWFSGKTARPAWLECQFNGLAWAITRYTLTSSTSEANTDPRDWQLLGSNDGESWTVLDSQTNQAFAARGQTKQYGFVNETPYWFYRLNITGTAGGAGSGARVAELQLFSKDTAGVASASAENPPLEGAAAAFDSSTDTKWFNNSAPGTNRLQYQFGGGAGWALSEYSLTSANDMPERDPRDWQFQASNDGVTWTNLDSRSGELFSRRFQTKSYMFKNFIPYRIYRLNVIATSGTGQGVQLSELDFGLKRLLARIGNPDGGLVQCDIGAMVAASSTDAVNGPDKVHDRNEATSWFSGRTRGSVWLQYGFNGTAWAISQYKLTSSTTESSTDPRDWQLLASNDGDAWIILDSQTNQAFNSRRQTRRYPIPNRTPYRLYRLSITANAGGNESGVRLAEFQLWSDDTPAVATASAQKAPPESAAQAFDGAKDTKWYNDGAGTNGWLQYEFGGGEARALSRYVLTSGNDVPERDPKDWQFQASNDGDTWTNLDVQTNQVFESRIQMKSYLFANHVPYRFYRLNITASRGADQGLQLSELDIGVGALTNVAPTLSAAVSSSRIGSVLPGMNPFANPFSLVALDDRTIAWGQTNCLWSMSLTGNRPRPLLDIQTAMPANTTLRSFSYSKETGQFLLSCDTGGGNSLWRFDPNNGLSGPGKVVDSGWSGLGISGGGWVARKDNYLLVQRDLASEPVRIVPRANIDGFTVSPDGRQLFILGTIKNEAAAGIWQYDFASAKLNCVVPYGDKPSLYAGREDHTFNSLKIASGQTLTYEVFSPANGYKYKHRKYPLVIGYTCWGSIMRGAHGRLWIPAVASCDAYVVFVNRPSWWDGIERWSDNVSAVYNELMKTLPIDKNRVFLFGSSAETSYMSDLVTKSPGLWRGVILLNPTGLPDFAQSPVGQSRPRILISLGGEEHHDQRIKDYQANAMRYGASVDYIIHPEEGHHLIGNVAQRQRTEAIVKFVFER